jgi:hypothetical protein
MVENNVNWDLITLPPEKRKAQSVYAEGRKKSRGLNLAVDDNDKLIVPQLVKKSAYRGT